ncbi:MarR family winged helix-turn-helix transcriptional regulator [Paenibacillus puldeungensis]|uniref:MarR family winged helix-turn-helix transcriptional regulator n=1 Tax=Paenibacillus puldeungensis TaxID=696536 RepID=A0ABW3RVD3_9BACL
MENNKHDLKLEEHLCFSLYACSRAILRVYRPYLDELQLTYPQYLVLVSLWEKQTSTVKELGEALDLDTGTLTPMLKRMETAGLITRQRDTDDERVVNIHITPEGMALQEKAGCIPQSLLQASGMKDEEIRQLNSAIQLLLRNVNETGK